MSQVDVRGNIIIDGQTTAGFDAIASKIERWGQQIRLVGDKIWEFEKDSLEIYKDYETNMLQARAALSSTYDSTVELDKVMETLGENVQDWAANSIFHVKDFSGAVNNAAHAGWTLEQQLEGIPRAMLLAQAGGLDLSDGLEYLARALNVTGTDFKDSGTLVDQWVKASHLANLTIEDLGESLNRMGVTAQLTDSTAELFTMLDALANTGSVGSEAGTLLRGTIMRLIAPTEKATKAMEQLQATQEELDELAGDSAALQEANKLLAAQGFSAYDTNGQLKPLMQTYGDLYDALVAIAGTEEDLLTNSEVDKILAAIFPQRQISGALSFLQAVKGGWEELFQAILNSEGTAQADADTMMSGLMGAEELFKSKWEEFQRKVGEELSGPFEGILDFLGRVVDNLNALPTDVLDALLGGLTGIAALGSTLGVGSGVYKFISLLGVKGMALVGAAFAIGAIAGYLKEASEAEFESNFGEMALDIDKLKESMVDFVSPNETGRSYIKAWSDEVDAAAEAYGRLAESFAQELTLDTLTNKVLNADDIGKLKDLGNQMQTEVVKGIKEAAGRDKTTINQLLGVGSDLNYDSLSPEDQQLYDSLFDATEKYYSGLELEAYKIGANIRDQLTAALGNGDLTPADRAAIQAQINRYNEIMAEIADAQQKEARYALFARGQTLSWDSAEQYMTDLAEGLEGELAKNEADWAAKYGHFRNMYETFDENGNRLLSEEDWKATQAALLEEKETADKAAREYYGQAAGEGMETLLGLSSWGDVWKFVTQDQAGNIKIGEDGSVNYDGIDLKSLDTDTLRTLGEQAEDAAAYSGKIAGVLAPFSEFEGADQIKSLVNSLGMLNNYIQSELGERKYRDEETVGGVDEHGNANVEQIGSLDEASTIKVLQQLSEELSGWGYWTREEEAQQYEQAREHAITDLGMDESQLPVYAERGDYLESLEQERAAEEEARRAAEEAQAQREQIYAATGTSEPGTAGTKASDQELEAMQAEVEALQAEIRAVDSQIAQSESQLENQSLIDKLFRNPGANEALNGGTDASGAQVIGLYDRRSNLSGQYAQAQSDFLSGVTGGAVQVSVDADTEQLQATIQAEEGQTLMQYVDGDTTDLHMSIYDEDGQTLVENVTGNASSLASIIDSYNGKTVTVYLKGQKLFAEGGRATEPSIFGEVPGQAEWAIPEAHTERTAQLLANAAQASGFTWGEIIGRFGGLNADPNHINVNLSYSPTINAANAEGVEAVLDNDKTRVRALVEEAVQRALENAKLRDDVEVYA